MNALIENEIQQIEKENTSYVINTNEDLVRINTVLRGVKALQKKVKDELDPEIKKANDAHKGLTALKKKHLQPLEDIEDKINQAIKAFHFKKQEEARLLQEKINSELAQKAEEVKQKLLKESETANEWNSEILKEKATSIVADTVNKEDCMKTVAQAQEGQYFRSNWKAKVIDESIVPREFLIVDMQKLNAKAKEIKGKSNIPGVEFYDDIIPITKSL